MEIMPWGDKSMKYSISRDRGGNWRANISWYSRFPTRVLRYIFKKFNFIRTLTQQLKLFASAFIIIKHSRLKRWKLTGNLIDMSWGKKGKGWRKSLVWKIVFAFLKAYNFGNDTTDLWVLVSRLEHFSRHAHAHVSTQSHSDIISF